MDIRDRKGLKNAACASLSQAAYSPKKLVLIYTGVQAVISLCIAALSYWLSQQIGSTGGLSGLELRGLLSTARDVLPILQSLLTPFWQLGFTFAMLQIVRGQQATPASLLEGFRRFGPSARYVIAQGLILCGAAFLAVYFGVQLFLFTPMAEPLMALLMTETTDEAALMAAIVQVELPMALFIGGMLLLLCLPILYRYRQAPYLLMDHPEAGALACLFVSRRMMRGNNLKFIRLDLSMWWFYAVDAMVMAICYADMILPAMGIALPFDATTAYFVTYIAALVLQLIWYWFTMDKVQVTYTHAYEALLNTGAQEPKPQPKPGKQPWNYEA